MFAVLNFSMKMKRFLLIFSLLATMQLVAQTPYAETVVVIHTPYGDITAMLYNDTPIHRDNFIKLVKQGWYDGSPFHRVIKGFMIQGGGNKNGKNDPGYTLEPEFRQNHYHKKGALAAARMGDKYNPEKRSSGSQFYIVQGKVVNDAYLNSVSAQNGHQFTAEQKKVYKTLGGTPHLDGDYTVFGEVIDGLTVVDAIAAVKTLGSQPVEPILMSIEILE
jgi:peptidyl-prolyl cis-trans isomerase B (cyclophilin B)